MRAPSDQPLAILYDAECGFCVWLLSGLLRWDRAARLRPLALQLPEADELLSELGPAERMASWHLIAATGERQSGGAALAPLLRALPGGSLPASCFERLPTLTERGYRWTAEHRAALSRLVPSRAKQSAARRVAERERSLPSQPRP